jgi:hypothetical protein
MSVFVNWLQIYVFSAIAIGNISPVSVKREQEIMTPGLPVIDVYYQHSSSLVKYYHNL